MLKKAITTILLMCVLLLMACRGGENEKGESASEEMAESTTYMEAETLEDGGQDSVIVAMGPTSEPESGFRGIRA